MKKILIAIPTAKYIEVETFKSIYDLEIPEGYEVNFQYFFGYQVDQVRNLIADWIINGYDYLFSVDSDISFSKDTLKKLLAHDVPVVSGIYRQRKEEQIIEVYGFDGRNMPWNTLANKGLVEIGGCGFGCVLIKKEVFTGIDYPHFFYSHAIDHKNTISEDTFFCHKARSKGFKIYADTTIICGHHGNTVFNIDTRIQVHQNTELDRLRELSNQALLPQQHVEYLKLIRDKFNYTPKVIYDIGACVLHWYTRAKEVWPTAEIFPIEAMHAVGDLYEEKGILNYYLGVLSDSNEKIVEFYENMEHPGGNSYFKENAELSPGATVLFPEEKKVLKGTRTLDWVIETRHFPAPDMIKMDIQGAELDVLKGAENALKTCKHLILELQHKDYNFGAPKAQEVIKYLEERGWTNQGQFCCSTLGVDGDYHFVKND